MKYHLLSIMLLFSVFVVYGQGWNEAMIYPPSSEAFAQSRLTETQLEPSGNFSYSLPLYTINTKDISLPISLDYTSGVKVNDLGGVVGMGWNLSSGGVISRVMRGLPDEDHVRYIPNYSEIWQENPAEWTKFKNAAKGILNQDTEYDIFRFNLGNGLSGEFFIEKDLSVIYNGKDNIKIQVKRVNPGIGVFLEITLTDSQGNRFIFGGAKEFVEKSSLKTVNRIYPTSVPSVIYDSSWFLKKVISRSGEVIDFQYVGSEMNYVESLSSKIDFFIDCPSDPSLAPVANNWIKSEHRRQQLINLSTQRIKKISTNQAIVEFEYGKTRLDVQGSGVALLTGVQVKSLKGTVIKNYSLLYDEYTKTVDSYMASWYRLSSTSSETRYFLKEVKDNLKANYAYSFVYHNPEQLEPRFSFQQDVDGYTLYNFTRNTSPFSSISKDHPLVPVVKKTNSTNLFSGNFEPNSSRVGVGNLIKIIYPTKGYSSIEYSSHLGSKKERVWTTSGGTFHLRRGCKDPREVKGELEITMDANSTTLEVTAYGSVDYYACAQNGIPSKDFHDRLFFSVYDIAAQKYIYSTSRAINDGIDQSTESCLKYGTNCPINVVPGKKYRIEYQVTSYFNQVLGVFSISYNGKYVDKIIPNVVIAGGSKVSSVIDYDQDGTITSKKEYFYSKVSNLSKTDNSIINRSKGNYYSVVKTFPLCITSQEDSNGYMWMYSGSKTDVNRHTIHEKSITNDYLTVGNSIYFGTITEKVDNISYRERNFEITSTVPPLAIIDTQLPNVPYENQQVENYLLKSEINYKIKPNGGYAKVNETINNYLKVSPAKARLKSQVIVENFTMPSNIVLGPYALEPYSLTEYVNSLVFNVLSKVDEIQYDENGALAVKKTIVNSYKDNNLSSSVTSFSNSSDKYTSQYFYAKDKNLANLINLNVVGVPVEIKTILNGSLLERELFTFENYVYPTNYKIFGKDNISLKQNSSVFYDKSNGNILEIIRYDGSKEVMLYGYNKSLLICKVLNSSKEEVATALSTTVDKLGLINESNMTSLNALRTKLPNAQVQTYLHNPLIGVTKIIESNGVSSNFEYDPSHRLKAIKDDKGNFVQEFEYNYRM